MNPLDAAPEEGLVARAADGLEAARKKALAAEKEAADKKAALETLQQELTVLEKEGVSGAVPLESREALKEDLEDAASGAEKAHRRGSRPNIRPMRPPGPSMP